MLGGFLPLPQLVSPANKFACCFSLGFGVKLIMWPHLVLSLYSVATAIERILSGDGAFDAWQIFETVWSMLGVPLVAAGLWGVYHRLEPHVRLYLDYLTISVAIDLYQTLDLFLMRDSCVNIKLAPGAQGGRAFACGVARSISMTSVVVLVAVSFYLIYVVWSWCEEVDGSAAAYALTDLLAMADGKRPPSVTEFLRKEAAKDLEAAESSVKSIASGASIVYGAVASTLSKDAVFVTHAVEDGLENLEDLAVSAQDMRRYD